MLRSPTRALTSYAAKDQCARIQANFRLFLMVLLVGTYFAAAIDIETDNDDIAATKVPALPTFDWQISDDGTDIDVTLGGDDAFVPHEVTMWKATTCDNKRRDFRATLTPRRCSGSLLSNCLIMFVALGYKVLHTAASATVRAPGLARLCLCPRPARAGATPGGARGAGAARVRSNYGQGAG